ncbi:MAG: hypothetical protein AABZ64_09480 [Nitrospinota bacterium]
MFPLVLLIGLLYAKSIPGVPPECCGTLDCRPASVQVLRRGPELTEMLVDGVPLTLPTRSVVSSHRGYYCYRRWLKNCEESQAVSKECATCAVEAGVYASAELLPRGHERWLVLPLNRDCGECHFKGEDAQGARYR